MASSTGNTNPQNPPFDIHNFFRPSANPYRTPPASYPPPAGPFLQDQYYQHLYMPPPLESAQPPQQEANLHHQRLLTYPTPPLNLPSPRCNHNAGTHILALLNNNNGRGGNGNAASNQYLPGQHHPALHPHEISRLFPDRSVPIRVPSCKLPRGRRLVGDHVVYDVDVRLQGEVQPQLEVTPITKYGSDPQLVLGRQIAVNKVYICYGLKGGNIRVLNVNSALRSLFRGHTQRVTDMVFFAEDVHLLASISIEGRVCVWKISEGSEGEDQPQIRGEIVLAIQILGEDAKNPRVCWHNHKPEILAVSIGKHVLRIDTHRVGKGKIFSAEAPLEFPLDKLTDGIQLVGKHDGEVTDLSMCQWTTTRLVSSSMDGTIKIWEDHKAQPLVLRPHDGHPVNSATFLTAPERPDHIILITGGPLNREIKIWVSTSEKGWLPPSDAESWKSTQTLDLKSSTEPHAEDAFFNQAVQLSQAGLVLLANAKRNAIYAVHLDYGPCPDQTRMDYLAEFAVTTPILSFTGTNDPPDEHFVKVYCVQTQGIQLYTLDLCYCLPAPRENVGLEKSDSRISQEVTSIEGVPALVSCGVKTTNLPLGDSVPKPSVQVSSLESTNVIWHPVSSAPPSEEGVTSNGEPRSSALSSATSDAYSIYAPSVPLPVSPRISSKLSGYLAPAHNFEPEPPRNDHIRKQPLIYSVNSQKDTIRTNFLEVQSLKDSSRSHGRKVAPDDVSPMHKLPIIFKHPTHLITPSEILMTVSSADATITCEGKSYKDTNIQNVNTVVSNTEVEDKEVGETRLLQDDEMGYREELQNCASENREKIFCSQASALSYRMTRECHAVSEKYGVAEESELHDQSSHDEDEEALDSESVSVKLPEPVSPSIFSSAAPSNEGKKKKANKSQGLSSSSSSAFNLADSYNGRDQGSILPAAGSALPQILVMQEKLNQLLMSQKEMQKQLLNVVDAPVKEGKRLEAALGGTVEKVATANADALGARVQEEFANNEKSLLDHSQQIANVITKYINKELNANFEKVMKKEIFTIVPAVTRALPTAIEKAVSPAIVDSFQRGVGDKATSQLEKSVNSRLEATVARQIQAQFQTSGRQALQDALKSGLEASLIPAFEMSCKMAIEQIDAAFQKGIAEHTNAAQQHLESTHSQLALALGEAINSASSMAQTLNREVVDGQRKLLAVAAARANPGAANPLVTQLSNGPLGGRLEKSEAPLDPTKELSRLISEYKYEEAFTCALQRGDLSIVSWLCSQVDLHGLLAMVPLPLSQGVLLSLLQQLACDINKDTARKLAWMTDVAAAINLADQMTLNQARPVFEQVYRILHHQQSSSPSLTSGDHSAIRLLMRVIHSMLMGCK